LSDCQRGVLVLQVFPRGQGESREAPAGDPNTEYLLRGIHSPVDYFYRGAFMDILRGVDYLLTRPDVAVGRIGAMGTSQGGALVLNLSALEPRIRAVTAHLPFFCDVAHNAWFRNKPLSEPQNLKTFAYFDPLTQAPQIQVPALLSSGGRDELCPAETIRAVFDRLSGIKTLVHDPELIHTASPNFYRMCWDWMDRHL
jgi:cephalosporin-C deacetylase